MNDAKRKQIIDRIRALQARTVERGCTEAEALAAANMVGRLLTDYDLSMTDVEIGEERCGLEYLETGRKTMHEIQYCLGAIAHYADVKLWRQRADAIYWRIALFGTDSDVEFAKFLIQIVRAAMDQELARYRMRCSELGEPTGRRQSNSFLKGMAARIAERLRQMKRDQQADTVASTGRNLMVVKGALVKSEFAKLNIRLIKGGSKGAGDHGAHSAGKAAGDRVGFNRPVGGRAGGYMIGN